ncbi:MAG TPA: Spy/CpxP family protein refolding chaperone [Desulfomonilaceae bacterium]|nr:Spy/CpxP family protein refolding chaperone [Desulfomonilaceae bacterium]
MNTMKIGMAMVLALAVMSLAATCSAVEPAGKSDGEAFCGSPLAKLVMGNIGRFLVLRSELGLTNDQRKKIAGIVKSHRDEIRPVAKALLEKRRAVREAVINKPGDEAAIRTAATDLGQAIGDASVLASKVGAQVKPVLTPQQVERIENFRAATQKATSDWLDQMGK